MERVRDYISYLPVNTKNNPWIILEDLAFREIDDNAPHHSNITTHPFHMHCSDGTIQPSQEMNLIPLLPRLDNILETFVTPSP